MTVNSPPNATRTYRPVMSPTWWWLRHPAWVQFMLRELSSVFIAAFLALYLARLGAFASGPAAYAAFQAWHRTPLSIALHVLILAFALLHSTTWFLLTPKIARVHVAGRSMSEKAVAGGALTAWAIVSALVAWWLLG
ncbi:MAG: fumarate reductase subunit C [Armatimonadetes bacterium]|nr:fumarate reductase subunit C [Armatimonadota bacterium]